MRMDFGLSYSRAVRTVAAGVNAVMAELLLFPIPPAGELTVGYALYVEVDIVSGGPSTVALALSGGSGTPTGPGSNVGVADFLGASPSSNGMVATAWTATPTVTTEDRLRANLTDLQRIAWTLDPKMIAFGQPPSLLLINRGPSAALVADVTFRWLETAEPFT